MAFPSPSPSSSSNSPNSARSTTGSTEYQGQLLRLCGGNRWMNPKYEFMSDRRGGRTAWTCTVSIPGQAVPPVQARFWYDGRFVNGAKEDAAQVMLQRLGQIPQRGVPPAQYQQEQQEHRRNYGPVDD